MAENSPTSTAVALKLSSKDASRILRSVMRMTSVEDTIHVVCVLLQSKLMTSTQQSKKQSQDQVRHRFGVLLQGRKHRLHIVRVCHEEPESRSAGHHVARALCVKVAVLCCSALVVGGQLRPSASGALRSSLVADAVRRHARCPVLLASSTYTVLPRGLPAIAEEPSSADALASTFESCCLLDKQPSDMTGSQPASSHAEPSCGVHKSCQGHVHLSHVVHLAATPAAA